MMVPPGSQVQMQPMPMQPQQVTYVVYQMPAPQAQQEIKIDWSFCFQFYFLRAVLIFLLWSSWIIYLAGTSQVRPIKHIPCISMLPSSTSISLELVNARHIINFFPFLFQNQDNCNTQNSPGNGSDPLTNNSNGIYAGSSNWPFISPFLNPMFGIFQSSGDCVNFFSLLWYDHVHAACSIVHS